MKKCFCVNKNSFPLKGECKTKNIIFQASLNSNKLTYYEKYYKGSCETTFEKRFVNHRKSFNNDQCKTETKFSKEEVWSLKSIINNSEIAWKIAKKCASVNGAILRCNLCLDEMFEIATL